jgi:cytochrome c5
MKIVMDDGEEMEFGPETCHRAAWARRLDPGRRAVRRHRLAGFADYAKR